MKELETEIGKIFCKWDDERNDFDRYRVMKKTVEESEEDNPPKITYMIKSTCGNNSTTKDYTIDEFLELKKDCVLLKSDGIISVTNIVAITGLTGETRDVLMIFFPNNKATDVPDIHNPFVVARQGVNDIFMAMFGVDENKVGCSVSIDTIPDGYALTDFMQNDSVIDSKICHYYKTDKIEDIVELLGNDVTSDILNELYTGHVNYIKDDPTVKSFDENSPCIDGFCKDFKTLLENVGFLEDVRSCIGIVYVNDNTEKFEDNKPISDDQKVLLSALIGGAKIIKAVPLKFDYDINLAAIKMKFMLVMDADEELWVIPYTESPFEIDAESIYNLTEERTQEIHKKLMKCVAAYDASNSSVRVVEEAKN